jgi:hypothetical protein
MRGRPQLQILRAIAGPDAIDMVDGLVVEEWATELSRHHQPVFDDVGRAGDQPSLVRVDGHGPVAVMEVPRARRLTDGHVRQRVTVLQQPLVIVAQWSRA